MHTYTFPLWPQFPLADIDDVVQVACIELYNPNFQFLITKNDVDKTLNSYQVRSLIFLHACQQDAVVLVCMHRALCTSSCLLVW